MHQRLRLFLLVAVTLFTPSLASAQQTAASANNIGPRRDVTAIAVRNQQQPSSAVELFQRARRSTGRPVALMLVGGAAILLGAIIGDAPGTLFMIGGAGVLLYGLYLYLQ